MKYQAETVIISPGMEPRIIREKLVIDIELVHKVALAKQLGFRKMVPRESCEPNCRHSRMNLRMAGKNPNPVRPLPLAFCETLVEEHYEFDTYWQVYYSWKLKNHAEEFFQAKQPAPEDWKEWCVRTS